MNQAFVALGSNLNNPIEQVKQAFIALNHLPKTHVIKKSSLYQTAPIGYASSQISDIPDFINAVVAIETELTPLELLTALLSIENTAGRERPYINAPRVLDCDLLLYADITLASDKLTLPHPRMHTRGFVLLPLFEIAPQLSIPNHGKIATLITSDMAQDIQKITGTN